MKNSLKTINKIIPFVVIAIALVTIIYGIFSFTPAFKGNDYLDSDGYKDVGSYFVTLYWIIVIAFGSPVALTNDYANYHFGNTEIERLYFPLIIIAFIIISIFLKKREIFLLIAIMLSAFTISQIVSSIIYPKSADIYVIITLAILNLSIPYFVFQAVVHWNCVSKPIYIVVPFISLSVIYFVFVIVFSIRFLLPHLLAISQPLAPPDWDYQNSSFFMHYKLMLAIIRIFSAPLLTILAVPVLLFIRIKKKQ